MLLRKSLSNTKRFFERTIENVKSLFSCANYQKLPKSKPSPYNNPYPHPYVTVRAHGTIDNVQKITKFNDLDYLYGDCTKRNDEKKKKKTSTVAPLKKRNNNDNQEQSQVYRIGESEGRNCMVAEKLRELEMIDKSNVDHLLDIEEVLHYYSRLTCPAYLDIVDNFFFDMYSEIFTSK